MPGYLPILVFGWLKHILRPRVTNKSFQHNMVRKECQVGYQKCCGNESNKNLLSPLRFSLPKIIVIKFEFSDKYNPCTLPPYSPHYHSGQMLQKSEHLVQTKVQIIPHLFPKKYGFPCIQLNENNMISEKCKYWHALCIYLWSGGELVGENSVLKSVILVFTYADTIELRNRLTMASNVPSMFPYKNAVNRSLNGIKGSPVCSSRGTNQEICNLYKKGD